jgi:2-phosphoglycerate kinase
MFQCKLCNVTAKSVCNFRTHLSTAKHIQNAEKHNSIIPKLDTTNNANISTTTNTSNISSLNTSKFACKNCNKELTSKYNLKRHFKTCQKTQSLLETLNDNVLNNLSKQNNKLIVNDIINDIASTKVNATHMTSSEKTRLINLVPSPTKGIIYLIQPVELIGTGRYKIGHSSKISLDRCLNGYNRGSRYINIQETAVAMCIKLTYKVTI